MLPLLPLLLLAGSSAVRGQPSPPGIPADWAARVADGRMLWNPSCAVSNGKVSSVWGRHAAVANGYIGTYVDSGTVYIAGAFTGLGPMAGINATDPQAARSHLARVPSSLAVRVRNGSSLGCALDLERATYYRRTKLAGGQVEQRWFASRVDKGLLVMEMEVSAQAGLTVDLSLEQLNSSAVKLPPSYVLSQPSDDVRWRYSCGQPAAVWCRSGWTITPDIPSSPLVEIAYVSSPVPDALGPLAPGVHSFTYVGAARSSHVSDSPLSDALALHARAMAGKAGLRSAHEAAWLAAWAENVLELDGPDFVRRAINATVYSIVSGHDESWSTGFPVSMEGLVEGSFGHWGGGVLWDADYWAYPAISMFRPSFAENILEYRHRRLAQARINAKQAGADGAKFPWQSTTSGAEVSAGGPVGPDGSTINGCGRREIHISADIVITARRHWWQTGNLSWLREVGQPLAAGVADYYVSRASSSDAPGAPAGALSLAGVLGPDEHDDNVTDSTYTNAAAISALEFAVEASALLGIKEPRSAAWATTAQRLRIPFDAAHGIHPEFEGMQPSGFQAKQADTIMIYFPLEFHKTHNISEAVAQADLAFYSAHTAPSPDMTHAIQCVAALDRAAAAPPASAPRWHQLADAEFLNSYQKFCFPPYYVFSENQGNSGDVLYLTSGAGFLQALIYGYAGVRVHATGLQLRPTLPPNSTRMALRGVKYAGVSLTLEYNSTLMTVALPDSTGSQAGVTLYTAAGKPFRLSTSGANWSGALQLVTIQRS